MLWKKLKMSQLLKENVRNLSYQGMRLEGEI